VLNRGIGTIAIFDEDTVSLSNLHRQILHTSDRIGTNKAVSAALSLESYVLLLPCFACLPPLLPLRSTFIIIHDVPSELMLGY
jgi:adenylyltransferase/sulfurtransferase